MFPVGDFRNRLAQRDLEISINENEYLRDRYLESKRAQEENVSEESSKQSPQKKQTEQQYAQIKLPSIQELMEQNKTPEYQSTWKRTPESKKKDAPEEKKEHVLDITLPTIQSLVDDYTKPYIYNSNSGKFEQIQEDQVQIDAARQNILNRPSPYGINSYEEAYLRATDPKSVLQDTRDRYGINKQYQVDRMIDSATDVLSAPFNFFGDKVANAVKSYFEDKADSNRDYIDDVISTWNISKNNAEFDTYVDTGIRLGEKKQYANIIKQYNDNLDRYTQLQTAYDNSTNPGERHNLLIQMNNILAQNSKLRPAVEEAVTYKYDTSVGKQAMRSIKEFISSALESPVAAVINPVISAASSVFDYGVNKVLGMLSKGDVGTYGQKLLDLVDSNEIKPGNSLSEDFLNSYRDISGGIAAYNKAFQEESDRQIARDKELALENKQEAIDWEAWHTPSKEFKAKEAAAQDNYLLDPGTYTHGIWTVLGSSASFNGTQILSTGLDWLGAGLLMAPHPGAKVAGAAATAAGGTLGLVSGVYENRAEITQNYIKGFRESLQKENKLQKFLTDGREQLKKKGIEVRDDDDVFRHFILKDYKVSDPKIKELALRHMFGANNAFQNDMMAVSSDVAFNTGLNLFGATGQVAESLKLIPEGSKFWLMRQVAKSPTLKAGYNAAKHLGTNTIASAISPLANIPYNIAKPVLNAAKSALAPMVKKMAKHMDAVLSWAKVAPQGLFKGGVAGKYIFDFLGKTATRGYSEAIEEGKQYEYGNMFAEGKLAGKSKSIFGTLIDDLSTGLYTGLSFIGNQFFGMQADRELMANMRGGFIGGILNHGTLITAVHNATNATGEIKAGDLIFNNVMAEKLRQRSNLINGEEMGKYVSRGGYVSMMNAFDRIQRIHDHITQDASDRVGLSQDELNNQRNMFRRIAALSNEKHVIDRAKALGIKQGTADFRKLVSLINVADQIQSENISQYNDLVQQAQDILSNDGLSLNVAQLFDQARAMATSQGQLDAIDAAESWAKWAQPLNNQIMGQYAALNRLIEDLEEREGFLTQAEQRNLEHYRAQREKLNDAVQDIRSKIGSTENMEFLNYGDPDILQKYEQIYRTLYQASAQLDTSTRVLTALYGENDSENLANDFVKEQLDFINSRINGANQEKKKAVKAAKKSENNKRAKEILNAYKQSVDDDIEFISELANRFDQDNTNYLGGSTQQQDTEDETPITGEPEPTNPNQPNGGLPTSNIGAQNLPVTITDRAPNEATRFPIGSTIENNNAPGKTLTVTDIKVNPSTGQYLLEVLDDNGDVRYIDDTDIQDYQKALPAPYHYERVLEQPNEWIKYRQESTLIKGYLEAKAKYLPAVIDNTLQDYLQQIFGPLSWSPLGDDPQKVTIETLAQIDYENSSLGLVVWHPIYGAIRDMYDERGKIYIASYRDYAQEIYNEFQSRTKKRLELVKKIVNLRDTNRLDDIRQILRENGIDEEYMNVLNDVHAINTIARQVLDKSNPHMQEWIEKLAFYTDGEAIMTNGIRQAVCQPGEVVFTNVGLASGIMSTTADIVVVDKNGGIRIYILAFPDKPWTDQSLDEKAPNQVVSRREYYTDLANTIYRSMDYGLQYSLTGIYVLPVSDSVGQPIQLQTYGEPGDIRNVITQNDIVNEVISNIQSEINDFLRRPTIPPRTKPQSENDGTTEDRINSITEDVKNLENTIAGVYNGTFSFSGRIRSDARQYLDMMRSVLTKHRNFLRKLNQTDDIKDLIGRIEQAYNQLTSIFNAYPSSAVYTEADIAPEGGTIDFNMPIIPVDHPLSAVSTAGKPVTATSDFISNGKVYLAYGWLNPQTGEFMPMNQYNTSPGVGVYATFTYNGIKYPPVLVQPAHYKNGVQPYTQQGQAFVTDIITLQNQSQGSPIVAEAKRLVPNVVFKGQPRPITDIPVLGVTIEDIQKINPDSDEVGIVNTHNDLQLVDKDNDKSKLWSFKTTQSGAIFYLYSFRFDEYTDGGVTPIKMIPAKLKKTDIDVIVSILKDNVYQTLQDGRSNLTRRYMIGDKESPFTNAQVLQMLTKFEPNPNNTSMFWVDRFGAVYFKQRASDPTPAPIDIATQAGEQAFRNLISNGYELAHSRYLLKGKLNNSRDPLFGGLGKWIQDNGTLFISDSLQFTKDDVDMNGEGFYGIGWALKHGRLLSNVSSIYEPSINIENPTINSNPIDPIDKPASTEQPKPHNKPKPRYVPGEGSLLNEGFGFMAHTQDEAAEEPLDEQEAREDIARMLGDAAVEFVDEIVAMLSNGLKAFGAMMDDVIVLSRLAEAGTQFHEAFHKIVELLLDPATRNRVYKAFANTHKEVDPTNARSISEGLAEEYRHYALDEKSDSRWHKYFARIKRFVEALLNKDRRILYKLYRDAYRGKYKNIKPSQENIDRFNAIFSTSTEGRGVLYHQVYNPSDGTTRDLQNVPSSQDYRTVIDTIVDNIISEQGADVFSAKMESLNLNSDNIAKLGLMTRILGQQNPDDVEKMFIDVYNNWNHCLNDVAASLKRFGLHFKHTRGTDKLETYKTNLSEEEQKAVDEAYDDKAQAADIGQYTLQDYEISKLSKMSERSKYFFATIPDMRFVTEDDEGIDMYVPERNSKGEEIDTMGRVIQTDPDTGKKFVEREDGSFILEADIDRNMVRNIIPNLNDFGFPQFAPFFSTCNIALNYCYSANSLPELLQLFRNVAVEHPQFVVIANRFASLIENMKRRDKNGYYISVDGKRFCRMDNGLYKEVIGKDKFGEEWYNEDEIGFDINYTMQAIAVSVFNDISGTRLHFKNVRSTRPSKNAIIFQVSNTDNGYSSRRYMQSWHSNFLSDVDKVQPVEVVRGGQLLVTYMLKNANLFKDAANQIRTIVNAFADRRSNEYKTGEIVINGKKVSVRRNTDAVKAAYLRALNSIGVQVTLDEFNHLLFKEYNKTDANALMRYFQQDGEDHGVSMGVSISKMVLAIEQGGQNGELSRPVISGSFYEKVGAFRQLANGIWSYNQSTTELMTPAPGKNRYYAVANRNVQDIFIQDLNTPQGQMARDLLASPYHRGSIFLESLYNGDVYMVSHTNAGYESDNKSDFGSDFMQMTNSEDAVDKMTLLLDNYITPPTLSNKKTYQPIHVIDRKTGQVVPLPGVQYIANTQNVQTEDSTAEVYNAINIPVLVDRTFNGEFITKSGKLQKQSPDNNKHFVLSDDVYDALIRYAFSEYQSVHDGIERLKTIPENEKVVNFDTATKGAKNPGVVRFSRFYEMLVPRKQGDSIVYDTIDLNLNDSDPIDNLKNARTFFFGDNVSREQRIAIIDKLLERELDKNLEYLRKVGVIRYRSGWQKMDKYLRYEPVAIDTAHLNAIIKAYGNSITIYGPIGARSIATCAMIFDICVKHQIAMEEYQRLFGGHPGLYVTTFESNHVNNDTGDLSKRLGGHSSTGETQCRLDDVPTHYNAAELLDFKIASPQRKELREWFDESESRFVLYANAQKQISIKIQNIRSGFESIFPVLKNKEYNADGIKSTYPKLFEGIEEDQADIFAEQLEKISKAPTKFFRDVAISALMEQIRDYKYRLTSEEYKRQRVLDLDTVKQELSNNGLLSGVETRVAAYSNNYDGKINVADGASYISPTMVKWMLQSIGKFTGRVYEAWKLLQGDDVLDPLQKAESYALVMDALFGTYKYTATGYRMNNGLPIEYYHKSAYFPIFKQNAHGVTKDMLNQMNKDGVHVLLFESAVKIGGQGRQNFPTTPEELANFRFNSYSLDFKYLRKQLNTDPKESDLSTVGSQTKKVALTILDIYKDDYVKADGTLEDGRTLKERIFDAERQLAQIGWKELSDRFQSEAEMAQYIRDNLAEKDADSDMLQGLNLVRNEDTEEVEMASPLEGLSNSEWIQSIITSLSNKHIVDVNLPGSAFIQRSVFSMEGNNIFGDNEIPSIPTLKISNDWSSMDAVVSIDYFYQQFPFLEKMSFIDARQWLINHNIIGENAKADTVAYRIPTQAASSIHALRFVDVISTVRDTIILPAEFTAITGSDFDIDKLFLSTKYYNYNEAEDTVTTEFAKDVDAKKHYGNTLLDCYIELLTQPKSKYANQLTRSIDYDTEIPMKVVNMLKQGEYHKVDAYDALQLYRQCEIKAENRTGGIGVGAYALNNNSEEMSLLFEVEYANVGIVKALDTSRLYDRLDAEGDSVLATIGAFITGHVDIAKNPWVTILNINEYTYDIHIYLARAGMGLRALWFCSQPIMRKMADVYIQSGGYLFDDRDESVFTRRQRAFDAFERDFLGNNAEYEKLLKIIRPRTQDYGSVKQGNVLDTIQHPSRRQQEMKDALYKIMNVIQQIFGVDPLNPSNKVDGFVDNNGNKHEGTILQDIALHHNKETDIYNPEARYTIRVPYVQEDGSILYTDGKMSTRDIQFFVYLANIMLDDPVSDMKKLVQLAKVETKKQGKNRAQQLSYNTRYEMFFIKGKTKLMLPDSVRRMATQSSINLKQNLFMTSMNTMLHKQLLSYTDGYEQFITQFIMTGGLGNDADTMKAIINGLTAWQKYQFIKRYAKQHNINMAELFVGNKSIYNELSRLRSKIIDHPAVYDRYTDGNGRITNALIAKLQPSDIPGYVRKEYGDSLPKFVDFQATQSDTSAVNTDIKAGWRQMLEDNEHPDIQEFARRLVVYAFMTSGDTNRFGSFFNKVPWAWRNELSRDEVDRTYVAYIKELIEKATNTDYQDEDGNWMIDDVYSNEEAYIQILKNNWFEDRLVPTVQETSRDELGRTVNNYFEYINNGEPILVALVKNWVDENGIVHFSEPAVKNQKAVIKIHKHDHDSYKNPQDFRLYAFVRMGTIKNEEGDLISFPIYGRTVPTGGVMYGHTIIQYGERLGFGWEEDTTDYFEANLDAKFREGLAQLYDWFDKNLDRNKQAVAKGLVTFNELREDTVKNLEDIGIQASFEDGTPIELTMSNSAQFYNMAKMMSQYLMLNPPKRGIDEYHNDSLSNIKKPEQNSAQLEQPTETKSIDVWSTNRDKYANLSNVAIRPTQVTASIQFAGITNFDNDIIDRVVNLMGKNRFNSVEQLFQLIKFEAMKDYVKDLAQQQYGLDRLAISKGKSREAAAIKEILRDLSQKQERIMKVNGAAITKISHEYIPDINGIVDSFWDAKWNQGGPENYKNSTAYKLIREIMLQSFLQNPGAAKLLLSTDDATITHDKGGIYWKQAFPDALMSVRDEISQNLDKIKSVEQTGITILGGDKIAYEEYSLAIKAAKEGKRFSDVAPFFTEEEAQQIQSAIPQGGHLFVSSVFRNNDPAFYAVEIINQLRENFKKPLTDPTRINIIELWSKHDGIPIQNILEACKKYRVAPIVSFSITGLGDSVIEKGVMKYNDLLDNIEKLIQVGILDPRTTTFRVDPILPGVSSVEDMRKIIERGVKMGIRKFVTSPMQTYSTQKNRDGSPRSVIPHIDAMFRSDPNSIVLYPDAILPDGGYNWMKYYGLHPDQQRNPGAIAFVPKKEYIKPYADMFEEMMAKYDITIECCAVPVGKLKFSACLDPEIIEAVTTLHLDAIEDKTRYGCHCYGNHGDMFRTTRDCRSSCGYCYRGWNNGVNVFDYYDDNGKLKDMAYTKVNEYEEPEDGPIEVVIKQDKYTLNGTSVVDANGQAVDEKTRQRVIWKRAVDLNKASLVAVNGIYYVVTTNGLIFNWGTASVENLNTNIKLRDQVLEMANNIYSGPKVSTMFNAAELKQLGESRMKFCKHRK